jgi:hypothetical protein
MALRRTLIQCVEFNYHNSIRTRRARHVFSIYVPSDWSPITRTWLWQLERSHPLSTDTDATRHDHEHSESTLNEPKIPVPKSPQILDEQWEANYEKMKEMFDDEERNESSEKYVYYPDKKVATWLYLQRHLYRQKQEGQENALTDEREQKLLDLGVMKAWVRQWMQWYERLQNFVKERGCFPHDCKKESLSKEDAKLVIWSEDQRWQYKLRMRGQHTSMTEERQEKLVDIGFCFDVQEKFWMDRYGELQEYRKHHGDCLVPNRYAPNPQLGLWVRTQRADYKIFLEGLPGPCSMTTERIDLLNKLDFVWFVADFHWNERYRELQEYYEHHGDCLVPIAYKANPKLAIWVGTQRDTYKTFREGLPQSSVLTTERIDLLSELDFVWSVSDYLWNEKYILLEEHVLVNGLGSLPSWKRNKSLRTWVGNQQKLFRNRLIKENTMTEARIRKLDRLGFPWAT